MKQTHDLRVKLSEEDFEKLEKIAEAENFTTISSFVRFRCLNSFEELLKILKER